MSEDLATRPAPARSPKSSKAKKAPKRPTRNPELDAARGAALLLALIVVTAPTGTLPVVLARSAWEGAGIGNLLPAVFSTLAGVAIAFQVQARAGRSWTWWATRLGRRLVVLVTLGIALAWLAGSPSLVIDAGQLRWTSDLARIGVASVLAVLLVRLPRWGQVAIATVLLALHHAVLLSSGTALTPAVNGFVGLDRALLGGGHVAGAIDRNGVTALAPTLVLMLAGSWIGTWMQERSRSAATAAGLLLLGALAGVVAWSWQLVVPSVARLWTGPAIVAAVALTLGLLAIGHLGTRWHRTDVVVAVVADLGRVALPLWVLVVLIGRWVTSTDVYVGLVSSVGELITPFGAVLAGAAIIAVGLLRVSDRALARGWALRA